MLTKLRAGQSEDAQAGEPQPTTPEATPGARSAEGPSPASMGYMGPSGLGWLTLLVELPRLECSRPDRCWVMTGIEP